MFQAGEQHEQSPAGTRSRWWRWSWEPELKLSICPSAADALRLPRQRAARGYLSVSLHHPAESKHRSPSVLIY